MHAILAAAMAMRPGARLLLTDMTATKLAFTPSNAVSNATFTSAGDLGGQIGGVHTGEYLDRQIAGIGAAYEINFSSVTGDTGSLTGSATDTWHDLNVDITYTVTETDIGTKSVSGTVTIRKKADTSDSVSASLTIQATVATAE